MKGGLPCTDACACTDKCVNMMKDTCENDGDDKDESDEEDLLIHGLYTCICKGMQTLEDLETKKIFKLLQANPSSPAEQNCFEHQKKGT